MNQDIQTQVAHLAHEMFRRGLTDGTSGNVSVIDRQRGLVAITPSDTPYEGMEAGQIALVDLDGAQVGGPLKPSSEKAMHLSALQARPDISVVLHTHSRYAIALACAHHELPAITVDMAAFCGACAPVVPYLTPGSDALAQAVAAELGRGTRALLLANHGTLVATPSPETAILAAEALELAAMAYIRGSVVGQPVPIPPEEVAKLLELIYGSAEKAAI